MICFYCRQPLQILGAPPDLEGVIPSEIRPPFFRVAVNCPSCGADYEILQRNTHGPTKPYNAQRPEGWEPEAKA